MKKFAWISGLADLVLAGSNTMSAATSVSKNFPCSRHLPKPLCSQINLIPATN